MDIWTPHPNPLAAKAEDRLYLAGARALQALWRDLAKMLGLPEQPPEGPADGGGTQ